MGSLDGAVCKMRFKVRLPVIVFFVGMSVGNAWSESIMDPGIVPV
jgi:hypothetical protein